VLCRSTRLEEKRKPDEEREVEFVIYFVSHRLTAQSHMSSNRGTLEDLCTNRGELVLRRSGGIVGTDGSYV
jgi:hypothetical protein